MFSIIFDIILFYHFVNIKESVFIGISVGFWAKVIQSEGASWNYNLYLNNILCWRKTAQLQMMLIPLITTIHIHSEEIL